MYSVAQFAELFLRLIEKHFSLSSRFTTPAALSIGQKFHYKRAQNYQQPSLQVRK